MSVIGPRPQLVRDMVFMTPEQRRRHTAKPGLSGLAQVNGRNAISWEDKIEWDLKYIEKVSLVEDIKIIFKTVEKAFVKQEGMDNRMYSEHAYQSDPEGDEPSADITLDEVGLCKGQKFALHYDFGDDWMFTITVSKISEVQEDFEPCVIKSKGTIQQYPDWDEEDFDEE